MSRQERGGIPQTFYKEIYDLEKQMSSLGSDCKNYYFNKVNKDSPYDALLVREIQLKDGKTISISIPLYDLKTAVRKIWWLDIGGFSFTVTPKEFTLDKTDLLPGVTIVNKDNQTRIKGMELNLSQQKAVLDWISASIVQRELCEPSPIEVKVLQRQASKS